MQLDLLANNDIPPRSKPNGAARIRYIGSKARVADALLQIIGRPNSASGRFIDLFCGAGSVSRAASELGWKVHVNDNLASAVAVTTAQLAAASRTRFKNVGGYESVVRMLNAADAQEGPIYKEYAPTGQSRSGDIRKYFTPENAAKIDGVRSLIGQLSVTGKINSEEKIILIADLISAANGVANIAGTYGCFLSQWTSAALREIQLRPRHFPADLPLSTSSNEDAFEFEDCTDDILYCDPPYTKRQYAAYYHLIETIAAGDHPYVMGVAGIRAWEHFASPFCYKRRAKDAFARLIASKKAKAIYLSYSSHGHVSLDELVSVASQFGLVQVHSVGSIKGYAPNLVSRSRSKDVTEYLIELKR